MPIASICIIALVAVLEGLDGSAPAGGMQTKMGCVSFLKNISIGDHVVQIEPARPVLGLQTPGFVAQGIVAPSGDGDFLSRM